MIDVHTHPIGLLEHDTYERFERHGEIPAAAMEPFAEILQDVDKALALAFAAPQSDIRVSNAFIAKVVRYDPDKIVGFASVHPYDPDPVSELEAAVEEFGLQGVKLSPLYQHFAPDDPSLWPLYECIQALDLPIMWHQGTSFMARQGPLEHARPVCLDKVAREFPGIKMVIAHFGYPWSGETVALLRKHENLYTDISAHVQRPWFLYNALVAALEYGAQDRILFGSDYPAATPKETAEALRRIGALTRGTPLPQIPDDVIGAIIDRDSLALLGIAA